VDDVTIGGMVAGVVAGVVASWWWQRTMCARVVSRRRMRIARRRIAGNVIWKRRVWVQPWVVVERRRC
jgi:hypothetical protein